MLWTIAYFILIRRIGGEKIKKILLILILLVFIIPTVCAEDINTTDRIIESNLDTIATNPCITNDLEACQVKEFEITEIESSISECELEKSDIITFNDSDSLNNDNLFTIDINLMNIDADSENNTFILKDKLNSNFLSLNNQEKQINIINLNNGAKNLFLQKYMNNGYNTLTQFIPNDVFNVNSKSKNSDNNYLSLKNNGNINIFYQVDFDTDNNQDTDLLKTPENSNNYDKEGTFYNDLDLLTSSDFNNELFKSTNGQQNNIRSENFTQPDIAISITSDKDSYFVNDVAVFTITAISLGNRSENIVVSGNIPINLEIFEYDVNKGTFNEKIVTWNIASLNKGEEAKLTLKTNVLTTGSTPMVFTATASNDTNSTNNVASQNMTILDTIDLQLTKTVTRNKNTLIWKITVENIGTGIASGVYVLDKLPKYLKYVTDNPTNGIYDFDTGIWEIGYLEPHKSETLTITTTATKLGSINNVADAFSNETDSDMSNNHAEAAINIEKLSKKQKSKSKNNNTADNKNNSTNSTSESNGKNDNDSKMPEAGNPILVAICSLLILVNMVVYNKK